MPDKKITDSEIVRILEETIEYNNRIGRPTAIMDIYSLELFLELIKRQNEQLQANSDSRQTNEFKNIDVARFEAEINRLQARAEKCEKVEHFADKTIETANSEIESLKIENKLLIENDISNKYPNCVLVEKGRIYTRTLEDYDELIGDISAEAYKECIEKAENAILPQLNTSTLEEKEVYYFCLNILNNLKKELVGEDNG